MNWADKAIESLEQDYEEGLLSDKELSEACKDVYAELESQAEEAADEARSNVLGY